MSQLSDALAGIPNAHEPVPGVITGGQPTRAQLEAFQAAGGRLVIDVRDPMEQRPFDEPAVARELGLTYVNVPVSPGATSDEKMNALLETLRTHDGEPTLFHCASGNRVGGPLIAWLMLDKGMDQETAVGHAMRSGLRSAEYLEWGVRTVDSSR